MDTDDLKEIVSKRLNELFKGETQEITANKLHMSQSNVSKWIKAQQLPTTDMLYTIAKTYRVSMDWLLGLSEEREVDGLATDKLTYMQTAKIIDKLIVNENIEIPNLAEITMSTDDAGDYGDLDEDGILIEVEPVYDSDYLRIRDTLLSHTCQQTV